MNSVSIVKKYIYNHLKSSIFIRKMIKKPVVSNILLNEYVINRRIQKINNKLYKLPPKLIVENTNKCNANCVMCPYPKMKRKKGTMSLLLFKKIIDEYSKSTQTTRLQMNNIGEPLLDPLIIEKIKYAKKQGIDNIYFFTNGALLSEKNSKDLINSGIDNIIISLDGASKETYENIRIGLDFNQVIKNIENFINIRSEFGLHGPKLELHLTLLNKNSVDEEVFIKKISKISDEISVTYAHDWAGQQESKNTEYAENRKKMKLAPCSNLWSELTILWNGDVAICCFDYEGKIIINNIQNDSLQNVWKSKQMTKLRQIHMSENFNQVSLCKNCNEHTRANWMINYWD